LTAVLALLIVTGYLLYYAASETIRPWTSIVHWVIGFVLLPLFLLHYRQGRRIGRT
jgi:uncharacterized protein (DUF983 family)